MKESLTKAIHDLGFARDDLKEALKEANAVQKIVLLDIIWRTIAQLQQTKALLKAIEADAEGVVKP